MDNNVTKRNHVPWIGILFVVLGIMFILDNAGYIYFDNIFEFWPLILVFVGVTKLTDNRNDKIFGGFLIALGIYLQINNLDLLPYFIEDNFWAIMFILFGIFIILQRKDTTKNLGEHNPSDFIDVNCIFGGTKNKLFSQDLKGGQIVAIFGGPTIDLRQAQIQADSVTIHVTVIFSGIDFKVPENWKVVSEVMPIFGGTEDKRSINPAVIQDKTLVIKGMVLFGGMDVKY
jgi:predicted membrane protein